MGLPTQKPVTIGNPYQQLQAQRVQQNNINNYKGGTSAVVDTKGNPAMANAAVTALNAGVIASNKRGGTRKRRRRRRTRKNI